MRFDIAMRVPFSLFAFALVRLALVRAVAFNRPYTTCELRSDDSPIGSAVSEWSAELEAGNVHPRRARADGQRVCKRYRFASRSTS